jgi:rhodanese-related sulfurtransferase
MPGSGNDVGRISAKELEARLGRGERIAVLDVRRREAWTTDPGRIPGAVWAPLEEVPERARDIPPDTHIVVYCS